MIVSYPVLRSPDLTKQFRLITDASEVAVGAVLAQLDNGKDEYACANAIRLLKEHKRYYSITELEILAIAWAVNHFGDYLLYRKFEIVTNHIALFWLFKHEDPNSRRMRWKAALQMYDYEIVYKIRI